MADETTQYVLGDAAVDALGQPRKRRFFGKRKKPEGKLANCENCGTALVGEYCSACGQHAIDYRRSLWGVAIDALDSFFNWDTKFLQTITILLTRPGKLTNDFNAGRRVRYVHPLRLYLLASIAFFLLLSLVKFTGFSDNREVQLKPEDRAEIDATLAKLTAPESPLNEQQRARVDAIRARWKEVAAGDNQKARSALDRSMLKLTRFAKKEEWKAKDSINLDTRLQVIEKVDTELHNAPPVPGGAPAPPPNRPSAPDDAAREGVGPIIQFDAGDSTKPKEPFEAWLETRIKEKIGEGGTRATLFVETLRSNIPAMMLCCVPLFAFVLKLLYWRQRRYYVEHLVYALHIHTFAYLAAVVIGLVGMGAERTIPSVQPIIVFVLSIAAVAQVFLSIRRVYGQRWFMTTFKFFLGGAIYFFVLVLGVTVTAFITLIMP
jgi:hypothetical protein